MLSRYHFGTLGKPNHQEVVDIVCGRLVQQNWGRSRVGEYQNRAIIEFQFQGIQ